MGTQGLVTITKNGKVIAKAICGQDGYNAEAVADKIRKNGYTTPEALYRTAIRLNFGCRECLVIQHTKGIIYKNEDEPLNKKTYPFYFNKDKFKNPKFNPRWSCGLADCIEIVEL
jgi:hypothetical protein